MVFGLFVTQFEVASTFSFGEMWIRIFQFLEALCLENWLMRSGQQQIKSVREVTIRDKCRLHDFFFACLRHNFQSWGTDPQVCMESAFVHMKIGHRVQAVLTCFLIMSSYRRYSSLSTCDFIKPKARFWTVVRLNKQKISSWGNCEGYFSQFSDIFQDKTINRLVKENNW